MIFTQLYSGSSANLYTVSDMHGRTLLIECGIVYKKLLKALNFDLSNIMACIVTHGHNDHSAAAIDLIDNGIDVYATAGTFQEIGISENCPQWRNAKVIKENDLIKFKDSKTGKVIFQVYVFSTVHDCKEAVGFLIREVATNEYMLFATDTAYLQHDFKKYPCKIIAIECSYDKDVLQSRVDNKIIDESLAKRLLTSHFEKTQTINFIDQFCNIDKCVELHLLHLSKENIEAEKARQEIENRFKIQTYVR